MIEAVKMACSRDDQASGYIRDNWEQKNNIRLRSVCDKIIETPSIERIKEHPVVVRWKKRVGDVNDNGDSSFDPLHKTDKKSKDDILKNLQEIDEKKSVNDRGASEDVSPTSPASPPEEKRNSYAYRLGRSDIFRCNYPKCKRSGDKWDVLYNHYHDDTTPNNKGKNEK